MPFGSFSFTIINQFLCWNLKWSNFGIKWLCNKVNYKVAALRVTHCLATKHVHGAKWRISLVTETLLKVLRKRGSHWGHRWKHLEVKQLLLGVNIRAAAPKTRMEMTTGSEVMWRMVSDEGGKWGKGTFQRAADQWGCSCQNLCASLLTERTRGQRQYWKILVAVQLTGTGIYPLAMLIGREKGRKTNLMSSESAWASANDGLHLTQQQCEQRCSGHDHEHVMLMTGRF